MQQYDDATTCELCSPGPAVSMLVLVMLLVVSFALIGCQLCRLRRRSRSARVAVERLPALKNSARPEAIFIRIGDELDGIATTSSDDLHASKDHSRWPCVNLFDMFPLGRRRTTQRLSRQVASTGGVQANLTSGAQRKFSITPVQFASASNPDRLPHYPVPPLQDTLSKYLRSVQPLLSDDAYKRTEQIVRQFGDGEGNELYALLQQRAAKHENWLSDWWVKYAYLGYRASVVTNSNPGLYFDVRAFSGVDDWLSHTARTVWATMRFKEQIDAKEIPADRMGKALLDMGQYGRIFGTCRIPRREFDGIEFHPKSDYVIVAFRNGFHKLPVYVDGRLLSEAELVHLLHGIVSNPGSNPPIGALSAQHRDSLAIAYEHLVKANSKSVETIQRALFVVCLDQAVALAPNDSQIWLNVGSHQLIHGGGAAQNSANRWFDKTLQLVVNENGLIGLNYEHSPGEGQPIAVLSDFIINHTQKNTGSIAPKPVAVKTTKLSFSVDAELQKHLDEAEAYVDGLANNLDMHVLDFQTYGKNFIKTQRMSPDSYIQMAMQYAFFKKHGVPGAHYETAQQRLFIHGRTETIRSCSVESVEFAKAMCSPAASDDERARLLRAAVEGHKNYTVMAMQGSGVDRLLLGLKLVARESDRKIPELYSDEGFVASTNFRISTSQVASKHKAFMCYGPAAEDGYGICYNPRDNDMLLAVSAFRASADTNAREMAGALADAFDDMYGVLVRGGGQGPTSKL